MTNVVGDKDALITDDWHVSGKIYRSPEIFAQEMSTIFAGSWIFVAHESEIASGGDYKTAYVGQQPVIVSRSADSGAINVMFNRCRHRGSAVCQREFGNANVFRCAYHGWTYNSAGKLMGVPFDDGYGPEFDKSLMGLVHVPQVGAYRGFIFANLSHEAPPLVDYLGHSRRYLDFIADLGDQGPELCSGVQKLVYKGNWKLQIENTIDPYHFSITHQSWLDVLRQRTGKSSPWVKNVRTNSEWRGLDLGGGHAVHEYGPPVRDANAHGIGIGELLPFNLNIFPTLAFVGAHLRLVVPRAVNETWVYLYPLLPKGADATTRSRILRDHEIFYGPSGFGSVDDIEVAFDRVNEGLSATATTEDWILMSRGLGREEIDLQSGIRTGRSSDEVPQRAYLRRWLTVMEAGRDR